MGAGEMSRQPKDAATCLKEGRNWGEERELGAGLCGGEMRRRSKEAATCQRISTAASFTLRSPSCH